MRRRVALAVPVAAVLALAGCAPVVSLQPAPHATSVGCAGVVVRMPNVIGTQQKRHTDAQGTAAWGTPASVVLRCGLPEVTVSSDPCFTYDGVNWLQRDAIVDGAKRTVLTTYGRTPTVQIFVDPKRSSNTDTVQAVSEGVRVATKGTSRTCVAPGDATPAPSSTPAPTAAP